MLTNFPLRIAIFATLCCAALPLFAAPVLTTSGGTVTYTIGGAAVTLDSAITVTDGGSSTIAGATISITSGLLTGDTLNFIPQNGIAGSYTSGVLTLSGIATIAFYQAALQSLTYDSTNADATSSGTDTTRTISWVVNDGSASSNTATSTVRVSAPPVITTSGSLPAYTAGGAPVVIDPSMTVTDADDTQLVGATASIASPQPGDTLSFNNGTNSESFPDGATITGSFNSTTGVLTMSGTASIADYQSALRSVVFSSSSLNPTAGGSAMTRTIAWQASDSLSSSTVATSTVNVTAPPVITAGNTVTFTEGGSAVIIDPGLTITDTESLTLTGASVTIGGFFSGDTLNFTTQNGISGSYNSSTGVLTLSGPATIAFYQTALRSITFSTASQNPTNYGADLSRTISWTVSDATASSAPATTTVNIIAVDNPPVLGGAGNTVGYTEGGVAAVVDSGLTVSDVDNLTLAGATVSITSGFFAGDTLSVTNQSGITPSYNASTGVLTLTGNALLAAYQTMLQSVAFSSTSQNPTNYGADTSRTITWIVSDGTLPSNAVTSTVSITAVNNPPVVSNAGNTATWSGSPILLDSAISVTDVDNTTLAGATVSITSGFLAGDTLSFTPAAGITGSYNSASGMLTLSGSATVAQYQTALESVAYQSTSGNPTSSGADPTRTVTWVANDGSASNNLSTPVTTSIDIVAQVVSVSVPPNGTYTAGQTLNFTVNFNRTVVVTGTPRIAITLDVGGTVYANYVSGSGTPALVFTCTVQSGQYDPNGIALGTSIVANGGTIDDANGFAATLTLQNAGSTAGVLIDALVAPGITKMFGTASIPLNGSTSLAFTLSNPNSGIALTNVGFNDALPSGLVVSTPAGLTGTCGGGTITAAQSSGSVSLSGATLSASGSCTFFVNVTGTTAGTKANTTSNITSAEAGSGGVATASLGVFASPTIAASFTPGQIPAGTTSSLTFTITNPAANPSSLTGVGFTNSLPSGLTVASSSSTLCGGTLTTTSPASIALAGASIAAGGQCQFNVTITGAVAGSFTNTTGNVTSANGGTGSAATAILSVASPPSIAKVFGAPSIALNASTSLTFTIGNANSIALNGVGFTDSLPAGLVISTPSGVAGGCGSGTVAAPAGGNTISLTGASVAAGGTCSFSVNVTAIATGAQNNVTGTISSIEGGSGSTAAASVSVVAPDLVIAKTHSGNFSQGQSGAGYTIAVTNAGGAPTSGTVTVTDTLPAALTATSISGSGWTCTLSSLTCSTIGVLNAGASYPAIAVTVDVSTTAPSQVTNVAHVSGGGEVNVTNDTATDVTAIGNVSADLSIVDTGSAPVPFGGQPVTFTLLVSNGGPQAATSVEVSDVLPSGAALVSTSPAGICSGTGTITCSVGALSAGATTTIAIVVTAPAAGGTMTNVANVTSAESDPNPSNNSSTAAVTLAAASAIPAMSGWLLLLLAGALGIAAIRKLS